MSMYPQALGTIPAETVRVASAACPKGTVAMRLRDALGELYQDEHFRDLYPVEGQPAYAPWRLALVTVLQYAENLTDRQAANAVRERIDWKYSLGLELTDAGFDFSLLSEFRTRLVDEDAETLLLDRLLEVCKQRGWRNREGQATYRFHPCVGTGALALQSGMRGRDEALGPGADGLHLLHALEQWAAPAELKEVASVQLLQQVWQQYYDLSGGKANWRAGPQASADAGLIRSPYDPEAQTGKKREMTWLGYKAHLTETCIAPEAGGPTPQLIVQVQTRLSNVQDVEVTAPIQEDLAHHDLLPADQVVDTG